MIQDFLQKAKDTEKYISLLEDDEKKNFRVR